MASLNRWQVGARVCHPVQSHVPLSIVLLQPLECLHGPQHRTSSVRFSHLYHFAHYLLVQVIQFLRWEAEVGDLRQHCIPPALIDVLEELLNVVHSIQAHLAVLLQPAQMLVDVVPSRLLQWCTARCRSQHAHRRQTNSPRKEATHLNGIEGAMHSVLLAELEDDFDDTARLHNVQSEAVQHVLAAVRRLAPTVAPLLLTSITTVFCFSDAH